MSTAPWPPHRTVHNAIIRSSWKSCRPALPVRGSSRPSQQAANCSKASPQGVCQTPVGRIDHARAGQDRSPMSSAFQMRFPCGCTATSLASSAIRPMPKRRSGASARRSQCPRTAWRQRRRSGRCRGCRSAAWLSAGCWLRAPGCTPPDAPGYRGGRRRRDGRSGGYSRLDPQGGRRGAERAKLQRLDVLAFRAGRPAGAAGHTTRAGRQFHGPPRSRACGVTPPPVRCATTPASAVTQQP